MRYPTPPTDTELAILRRYGEGRISLAQAAKEMGKHETQARRMAKHAGIHPGENVSKGGRPHQCKGGRPNATGIDWSAVKAQASQRASQRADARTELIRRTLYGRENIQKVCEELQTNSKSASLWRAAYLEALQQPDRPIPESVRNLKDWAVVAVKQLRAELGDLAEQPKRRAA